ncbi:MAG: hypothetical protein WCP21_22495, partial [Armatimonadota bacterium]
MQNRQTTTRLMFLGPLTAALLCAAATMVWAQTPTATPTSSDRSAFYLGSIRPAIERLQSITANPLDDGTATASPDQFSVGFDGRVSLHRDFARTVADIETAPLGVSFQDTTTTRGLLSLSQRTGLSYTSTLTQNDNLIGLIMGQTRAQAYGLQQTVGNGATAGALNATRTLTQTQSYMAADIASQTDAVGFTGGLRRANDLSVKGLRTVSDVPGGYYESNFEALYTAAFSGGDSPLGFARNEKIIAGLTTITEKIDFAVPVAWRGQKAIAEHHLTYGEAGGVTSRTRSSHVLLPFAALGPGALFDYSLVGADYGAGLSETGTARLANPFSVAGKSYALEENYITLHQPGLVSDTLLTRLSAPMSGGQAIVQHQTVSSDASGVLTEQRQVSLALPPLSHLKVLSAQAARSTTSVTGAADDNLTSFSVSCQPLRPLLVDAAYAIDDKGDLQASKTRQLRTRLALSNNLSLQGQLSEAEISGG